MTKEVSELIEAARDLSIELSETRASGLIEYLNILETTNRSFNLTRIPRADYLSLHLLDSLTAMQFIEPAPTLRILDIGTGAGFPGVPLAAALPQAQVTLLDSTAKKVRFAHENAHACGIMNCSGIHARAEKIARNKAHRERYDVVVSRAVAAFDTLIELMLPLTAVGGRAIALKGARYEEELRGVENLVKDLGGAPPRVHTVNLPGTSITRFLIVVDKIRVTPTAFPRTK